MSRTIVSVGALLGVVLLGGATYSLHGIGAADCCTRHGVRRCRRCQMGASVVFTGAGVLLDGWRCETATNRRGTLIYLHGVADNRGSSAGVVQRFRPRGFDVVAYDSRGAWPVHW